MPVHLIVRWPILALLVVALLGPAFAHTAHAQSGDIHVVEPGDTLSEIAAAHDTTVEALRAANGLSGNLIRIGQHLLLPTTAQPNPATPARSVTHTVRKGESLSAIARHYGVTVAEIVQANAITNPRLVHPGQELAIPLSAGAESETPVQIPAQVGASGKWIDVDLGRQSVVAYEGTHSVRVFAVSTGLPESPTVTGTFRIRLKMPTQDMTGGSRAGGDAYLLEDVPWVQYFFQDYAFHGTFWHNTFGYPASRGCINMRSADAEWLFAWTGPEYDLEGPLWQGPTAGNPGTVVVIHD